MNPWPRRDLPALHRSLHRPRSYTGAVSLNRSSCFCFAFKGWCWCNKKIKKGGIISRQSTCLPLYSYSIKLVQSIAWAYWSESSAVERAVCKINALFFSEASRVHARVFLSENKGETIHVHCMPSLPFTVVTLLGKFSLALCHLSGSDTVSLLICFPFTRVNLPLYAGGWCHACFFRWLYCEVCPVGECTVECVFVLACLRLCVWLLSTCVVHVAQGVLNEHLYVKSWKRE